jgi:hypothetical protein
VDYESEHVQETSSQAPSDSGGIGPWDLLQTRLDAFVFAQVSASTAPPALIFGPLSECITKSRVTVISSNNPKDSWQIGALELRHSEASRQSNQSLTVSLT